MKGFLQGAFSRACNVADYAGDLYDQAGLMIYRLFTDKTFLDLDSKNIQSPILRKAAEWYDWGLDKGQESLFKTIYQRSTSGDLSPGPDIKPALFKMVRMGVEMAPRINVSSPTIAILALGTVMVAGYALSDMSAGHAVSDIAGTWMSARSQRMTLQP